jgi:hypothetical protein
MILQLFIFAIAFIGFGLYSFFKKKKIIGILFTLLGIMLFAVAVITVIYYPQTLPFKF